MDFTTDAYKVIYNEFCDDLTDWSQKKRALFKDTMRYLHEQARYIYDAYLFIFLLTSSVQW